MSKKNVQVGEKEVAVEDVVMGKDGFESKKCGHINKQFVNFNGHLEDLSCELPAKHAGDHRAAYLRNVADPITDIRGGVIEQRYKQEPDTAFWGDAAGTPVKDIIESPAPQLTQFQKDIVAGILQKNPEMNALQAVEQAKTSPVWLAGNA